MFSRETSIRHARGVRNLIVEVRPSFDQSMRINSGGDNRTMAFTMHPVDLYSLACRSYDPLNAAVGFTEAFDSCFDLWGRYWEPDVIIQRVRSNDDDCWIGRFEETRVFSPFVWRLVWINPRGIFHGPIEHGGSRSRVCVIEDWYNDFDGYASDNEVPIYQALVHCTEHVIPIGSAEEERVYTVPWSSQEVIDYFLERCEEMDEEGPPESFWWYDVWLPNALVDGVPESEEHSHVRRRTNFRGSWFALGRRRIPLDDDRMSAIVAEEDRLISEGRQPP